MIGLSVDRALAIAALVPALAACRPSPRASPPGETPTRAPRPLDPEPAPGLDRWRDLDVDDSATGVDYAAGCAVAREGSLWCWGHDASAQVGLRELDGAPAARGSTRIYAPLARVADVEDAVAVATSIDLSCYIDAGETLRCLDASSPQWWSPVADVAVREVAVSQDRGCALTRSGTLHCWTQREDARARLDGVVAFSLAKTGGCALIRASGELVCWDHDAASAPTSLAPLAQVRDLARDGRELFALSDDGRVYRHALGPDADSGWTAIGRVEGGVELDVGRAHQCVRTQSGRLWCRGRNVHGQLGDGSSTGREAFVAAKLDGVVALAVSDCRSCALTEDGIYCAGLDRSRERLWQQHVGVELDAAALVAHRHTTCARAGERDELLCWGSDLLSPSSPERSTMSVEIAAAPRARASHIGGLTGLWTEHGAMAWTGGDLVLHHLLWVDSQRRWIETQIPDLVPRGGPLIDLVAGELACVIESIGAGDERLACGRRPQDRRPIAAIDQVEALAIAGARICLIDDLGAVACGVADERDASLSLDLTPVAGLRDAVALASTRSTSCALTEAGSVSCWELGALERGAGHIDAVDALALVDITAIAATDAELCTLDAAGAIACWGPADGDLDPRPTAILSTPQVELVAGSHHLCARDEGGAVSCWGREDHAQLGRVPAAVSLAPQLIARSVGPAD